MALLKTSARTWTREYYTSIGQIHEIIVGRYECTDDNKLFNLITGHEYRHRCAPDRLLERIPLWNRSLPLPPNNIITCQRIRHVEVSKGEKSFRNGVSMIVVESWFGNVRITRYRYRLLHVSRYNPIAPLFIATSQSESL